MGKVIVDEGVLNGIGSAIIARGGAEAPMKPSEMPAAIQAIPSGGDEWQPPSDWPDIRRIMDEYESDYEYRAIFLFDVANYAFDSIKLLGGKKYVLSDGAEYSSSTTHTWDSTKDLSGRYRWMLLLNDSENITISNTTNFLINVSLLWAYAPGINIAGGTGSVAPFGDCQSLRSVVANRITCGYNSSKMLRACYSLENFDVEEVVGNTGSSSNMFGSLKFPIKTKFFSKSQSDNNIGSNTQSPYTIRWIETPSTSNGLFSSSSMILLPDYMSMTATGADLLLDNGVSNIRGTPITLHSLSNFSLTRTTYSIVFRERFAKFDASGNLVGGMAFNMNEVSGLTATISATIKGFFTATEQAAIEAAFNAKGWTLAW